MSKRTSGIILIFSLILVFVLFFIFLIPNIYKESYNIQNAANAFQKAINSYYSKYKLKNNDMINMMFESVNSKIKTGLIVIFNNIFDGLLNLGEDILSFAIIPIIVYYFLCDSEYIGNRLLMFFPSESRNAVKKIARDADKLLGRYIFSQILLCVLIGGLTFLALILLKVPFPLALSALNGVLNIIPYFGPILGAIPPIVAALMVSGKAAIYTALWMLIIQQIEGNILSPKITGESISMHPLLVIILLIIGGKIGGFLGMVFVIPIVAIIKVIYEDLNYYLF